MAQLLQYLLQSERNGRHIVPGKPLRGYFDLYKVYSSINTTLV